MSNCESAKRSTGPPVSWGNPPTQVTWRELGVAAFGIFSIALLQIFAAGASGLFVRHFWIDEISTFTVSTDPDLVHMLQAIQQGVETHPPTLFLALRPLAPLIRAHGELTLRTLAFLAVLLALLGVYRILRTAASPLVALTCVAAVWAHPTILGQAFEARYYAAWLALAVWFCWLLSLALSASRPRWVLPALAAVSAALCTIHYFGILSLGLSAAALFLDCPRRSSWKAVLPAVALGPFALVLCFPLLLGQRAMSTVPSWLPDPSFLVVEQFVSKLIPFPYLAFAAIVYWIAVVALRRLPQAEGAGATTISSAAVALSAQLLMPAVLVAFSFAVQPALLDRYAVTTVAGMAPVMASLFGKATRLMLLPVLVLFLAQSTFWLHRSADRERGVDAERDAIAATIRAHCEGLPIVCELPHDLLPLRRYAPDLADRCRLLDFESGQLGGESNFRLFTRDLHRRFAEFYPLELLKYEDLRQFDAFCLVTIDPCASRSALDRLQRDYPTHTCEPVHGRVARLKRLGRG